MTIDYSRIGSVTARRLHRALLADGFILHRQRGSHRRYRHPDGRRVTLSFHHASDTFPRKTLKSIMVDGLPSPSITPLTPSPARPSKASSRLKHGGQKSTSAA